MFVVNAGTFMVSLDLAERAFWHDECYGFFRYYVKNTLNRLNAIIGFFLRSGFFLEERASGERQVVEDIMILVELAFCRSLTYKSNQFE